MDPLFKRKQKHGLQVFLGVLFLSSVCMGSDQQTNDYSHYELRAWDLFHQENSVELMPTVILSNLNRAIDLAPDRVLTDSYALRAHCWDKVGEDKKAFHDRMAVIQREPNNPKRAKIYAMLAGELSKQGENQLAMEYINRSILLAPDYAVARATRALIYVGMGAWDKWEEELQVAIELDPSVTNIVNLQEMYVISEERRAVSVVGGKAEDQ